MTYREWSIIATQIERHGYAPDLLDLGGVRDCGLADYLGEAGVGPGIVRPSGAPWDWLTPNYAISHDSTGHAKDHAGAYGTIVSTSVLEHVHDLIAFFPSVRDLLRPGGIVFLTTVFAWHRHGDAADDLWRFTDDGLALLATAAGLVTLGKGLDSIGTNGTKVHSWIVAARGVLAGRVPPPRRPAFKLVERYT